MAEPNLELDIADEVMGPVESSPNGSPDAPYGYKKDGTPAKKRGRPTGWRKEGGSTERAPRRGSGSLETQLGAFLFTVNTPFAMFLPNDALDSVEIRALAKAIDQECQRNARFRKYVENALKVQGGTSLLLVVAAIAGRRVVRHNIITMPEPVTNEMVDGMLGGVISVASGSGAVNPNLFVMPDQSAKATEA